ncbi:MAG TPA: DUF4373 domain-containing protein [Anaerohalosphaeraceae bacterium]|nr:DUF4373 domain-containing protein [Anaerohalosphaeraceae bacterium]HQI08497.1 DUF4373 domain-containing protein [Anaerohalosphaeraceae bacterium]HQJ68945.1 DUF4373 domain-containing protein [Anaerohalosphaeraceae bacterium]
MPRPRKKGLDYFPHDTDAAGDEKIAAIISNYGATGYAVFFYLLERIYREGGELEIKSHTLTLYAGILRIDPILFAQIIESAVEFGCFDRERWDAEKILTSNGIKRRIETINSKREKKRNYYKNKGDENSNPLNTISVNNDLTGYPQSRERVLGVQNKLSNTIDENAILAVQNRVLAVQNPKDTSFGRPKLTNKIKGNKIKEREHKFSLSDSLSLSFSLDDLMNALYDDDRRKHLSQAEIDDVSDFYNYYKSQGWRFSNGQPICDIPSAFIRWQQRKKNNQTISEQESKVMKREPEKTFLVVYENGGGSRYCFGIGFPLNVETPDEVLLYSAKKILAEQYKTIINPEDVYVYRKGSTIVIKHKTKSEVKHV